MSLANILGLCVLIVTVISMGMGVWNMYVQAVMAKIVAELQLNIKKDMNGRYVSISSFQDAKDRIARLEREHDEAALG